LSVLMIYKLTPSPTATSRSSLISKFPIWSILHLNQLLFEVFLWRGVYAH
jgi:hypothetical protein